VTLKIFTNLRPVIEVLPRKNTLAYLSSYCEKYEKSFMTSTPEELDFVFPTFEPEMDLSLTTSGVGQVVEEVQVGFQVGVTSKV